MAQEMVKAEEKAVISATDATLQTLERLALDPNVDADKMNRILDVQERIIAKRAETDFNAAMTAAQTEMGPVAADAENKQTRSRYASYAALDRVLRPIYTKHGFALSFDEGEPPRDDWVRVLCHVSHRGGFSKTYKKDMPADGKGAKGGDVMTKTHAAGSAMSYGMRYLLKGIFNVAVGEDDDDGNAATIPPITAEQVANLEALISEVGADKEKFLAYCKVETLEALPANRYKGAVAALQKKREG